MRHQGEITAGNHPVCHIKLVGGNYHQLKQKCKEKEIIIIPSEQCCTWGYCNVSISPNGYIHSTPPALCRTWDGNRPWSEDDR